MDARGGFLALGFTAVAVIGIAIIAYVATGGLSDPPSTSGVDTREATGTSWPAAPAGGLPRGGSREASSGDDREVARLQEAVAQREEELRVQARALAERESELADLRRQHDESLKLIEELVLEQGGLPAAADIAPAAPVAVETELLPAELARARETNRELEARIESLSAEMETLELELVNQQRALSEEYGALLERQRVQSAAATAALVQSGPEVVPALILALESPDPSVRIWAAGTLEAMGPNAREAIPALMAAQEDDDDSVRAAVRRALAVIRD